MIEIKQMGSYLEVDSSGYIIPIASDLKIQAKWKPVIEKTVKAYQAQYGNALVAVYVRGSVAKGEAIDGISDLDTIAIVDVEEGDIPATWEKAFSDEIVKSYPFVDKVEITVETPEGALDRSRGTHIMLKTQAVCVYGKDISQDIHPLKPGKEAAQHYQGLPREILRSMDFFANKENAHQYKKQCTWIMKRILRTGFELVMERVQKYTRDLYPCYESFSFFYPEKRELMRKTLDLALNPSDDPDTILSLLDSWNTWMPGEIEKIFG